VLKGPLGVGTLYLNGGAIRAVDPTSGVRKVANPVQGGIFSVGTADLTFTGPIYGPSGGTGSITFSQSPVLGTSTIRVEGAMSGNGWLVSGGTVHFQSDQSSTLAGAGSVRADAASGDALLVVSSNGALGSIGANNYTLIQASGGPEVRNATLRFANGVNYTSAEEIQLVSPEGSAIIEGTGTLENAFHGSVLIPPIQNGTVPGYGEINVSAGGTLTLAGTIRLSTGTVGCYLGTYGTGTVKFDDAVFAGESGSDTIEMGVGSKIVFDTSSGVSRQFPGYVGTGTSGTLSGSVTKAGSGTFTAKHYRVNGLSVDGGTLKVAQ